MTVLLTLSIVIFVTIAIWQMVKIFDLSQVGTNNNQIATDKDNKVNGYLMMAFLVFIYAITIYSVVKWGDLPLLSNSASEHGPTIDKLLIVSLIIIFIVQTVTQFLLHYFAYKYRGEKGKKALFYADNNTLEAVWTIIPVIVLAGLIISGLFAWTNIMNPDFEDEDPLIVELYAQQFNWKARYAGADNVLGEANVRLINIDRANILGVDENDPYAQDDVIVSELHLPVNRPVIFKMRSQDVLHSAYMPHFRAQMNCVPGMVTQFAFTPTVTTQEMRENPDIQDKVARINQIRLDNQQDVLDRGQELRYDFDYLLLCNKICGKSHYNMQMKIIVETQDEFDEWMAQQTVFENSLN
ncbi:cytochrome c oxidase subunit II [Paucihalobacter ruber]|uniref:Cytochrome c oxidase subunit 2 n=1 Tax=Paucihalobacter ruber TaxID=2567861 RepID=A0A506PPQ0_9FLAO|nr:cytochrome c oxidase subunit II [Paucihalobacter ruber]TPV35856.1 cytochrome c oxidase subunit II [Paucihalobacter ruber]